MLDNDHEKASKVLKPLAAINNSINWLLPLVLIPHLLVAAYLGGKFIDYPDQGAYLSGAENLLAGNGLSLSFDALGGFIRKGEPTSYYGLGAPLVYAAQIALFGRNYFVLRLGNILLFAASLFFFRGICLHWMSERWANLAMVTMGLSPFYIAFNQLFLSEMPFLFCELGTFFYLFRYLKQNATKDLVLAAVFVGLSLLVRTNLLFFLPVIAIVIGINKRWAAALLYLGVTVLVVAPYGIRNSINNHAFFPFDGKAALNLWQFNSDVHKGNFWTENFEQAPQMPPLDGLTEKERSDLLMKLGLEWIKQHPIGFARFAGMKAVRFFWPLPQKTANLKYAAILTPYAIVILAGFFVGLPTLWSRDPKSILVLLLFAYTLAIEMIFMTATRHRLLYDPFFVLIGFNYVAYRNPLRKHRQLRNKLTSNLIDARPARS
jgi:4-amino-4-deoxy-L-arabinose transferase-like glycosyltransferase